MAGESPTQGPGSVALQAFLKWLAGHGVDLAADGVEIRESALQGLGLFATRRLDGGARLAWIPAKATLDAARAHDTGFGRRVVSVLTAAGVDIAPDELLWLYMVWGATEPEASPWHPYLKLLPRSSALAWCLDESELTLLAGTPLAAAGRAAAAQQRARHATVVGALAAAAPAELPPQRFSFEAWWWARSCYLSRAFRRGGFPSDFSPEGWRSDVLLPLVDIPNHSHEAEVQLTFGSDLEELALPAEATGYEPGDEIMNMYARTLGNEDLLSHYGFAIASNPHDSVRELLFRVPPKKVASRLSVLQAARIAEVAAAEALGGGAVLVRLDRGLRVGQPETPTDLLRIASCLVLGRDYDDEAASSLTKQEVSFALSRSLRRMVRALAPPEALGLPARPRRDEARSQLRCRLWRGALRPRLRRAAAAVPGASPVVLYARSFRRLLLRAAGRATNEGELAALAAMMPPGDADFSGGVSDYDGDDYEGAEEPSPAA